MKTRIIIFLIGILILMRTYYIFNQSLHEKEQLVNENQVKTKITFMIQVIDEDVKTPLEDLIQEYNKTSNVKVQIQKVSYDQYQYVLNMKMLSNDQPDVFIIEEDWIDAYGNKGWLYPVTNHLGLSTKGNNSWTFPLSMETYKLLYRKDIFRDVGLDVSEPPKNLQELYDYALRISDMKIGIVYGFVMYLENKERQFINLIENVYKTEDIYYYNTRMKEYDFSVYNDWFETIVSIKKDSKMIEEPLEIQKRTAINQFLEGSIGMMVISSSDFYWIQDQKVQNIGVSNLPLDEESKSYSIPSMYVAVNSKTKNVDEVIDFCNRLISKQWGTHMYEAGYILPAQNITLEEMGEIDSRIPSEFLPMSINENYIDHPISNEEQLVRFNIYEQIMKNQVSVKEGLDNLTKLFNEMSTR